MKETRFPAGNKIIQFKMVEHLRYLTSQIIQIFKDFDVLRPAANIPFILRTMPVYEIWKYSLLYFTDAYAESDF